MAPTGIASRPGRFAHSRRGVPRVSVLNCRKSRGPLRAEVGEPPVQGAPTLHEGRFYGGCCSPSSDSAGGAIAHNRRVSWAVVPAGACRGATKGNRPAKRAGFQITPGVAGLRESCEQSPPTTAGGVSSYDRPGTRAVRQVWGGRLARNLPPRGTVKARVEALGCVVVGTPTPPQNEDRIGTGTSCRAETARERWSAERAEPVGKPAALRERSDSAFGGFPALWLAETCSRHCQLRDTKPPPSEKQSWYSTALELLTLGPTTRTIGRALGPCGAMRKPRRVTLWWLRFP